MLRFTTILKTCVGWWLGDLWGRRIEFVILGCFCPSGCLLGVPSARGLHRLCGLSPSHPHDTWTIVSCWLCYSSSGFSDDQRAFLGMMENSHRGFVISTWCALWLPFRSFVCAILLGWHLGFIFSLPFLLPASPPSSWEKFCLKKRVLLGNYSNPLFYEWVTWCQGGLLRVPQWVTGRVETGTPGRGLGCGGRL